MDEPALRDVERWKDKIEVRLDNRQVFFLFFGSAMVACMLFVLGVIVGKRLESRGRAVAPAVEDPLAALDRFGQHAGPAGAGATAQPPTLTFPKALLGSSTPGKLDRVERAATKTTLATTAPTAAPVATPTLNKKLAALPRPVLVPPPATTPSVVNESGAAKTAPAKPAAAKVVLAKAAPAAPASPAATSSKPTAPAMPGAKGTISSASGAPATLPARPAEKTKGGFALQLNSFQDRAEADAFARRFASQSAHVVVSEIPGKGTWYRVRVGAYGSMKEAATAKANFERDHNVIAYVAGSGPAQ